MQHLHMAFSCLNSCLLNSSIIQEQWSGWVHGAQIGPCENMHMQKGSCTIMHG